MPHQEGHEESQIHHHEESSPRYPGHLPDLRHQDVQDWQVITSVFSRGTKGWTIRPAFAFSARLMGLTT
jgi:hypothetical protein